MQANAVGGGWGSPCRICVCSPARPPAAQALHFDGGSKQFVKPDAASTRFRLDLVHLFRRAAGVPGAAFVTPAASIAGAMLAPPPAVACPPPSAASRPHARRVLPCVNSRRRSLLHGMAVQFLRSDWSLDNLVEHDSTKLPPWVRCGCCGLRAGPHRCAPAARGPAAAAHAAMRVGCTRVSHSMCLHAAFVNAPCPMPARPAPPF